MDTQWILEILQNIISILLVLAPLLIPQFREFIIKKYQLSLDKTLEDKKASNERKIYVSKVRFDKEFEVYTELSMLYNTISFDAGSLIYSIVQEKEYLDSKAYKKPSEIGESINEYQVKIFRYAPFIDPNIFKELKQFLCEIIKLINYYELSLQINDDEIKTVQKNTPYGNITFPNITRYEMIELFKLQSDKLANDREELNKLLYNHMQTLEVKE